MEGLYPIRSLAIRAHLGSAGEGDGYHGAPSAGVVWQASLMFPASCSPRSCVRAPGRVWVWSCGPVSEAIGSVWLKWIGFVPFLVGVMAIPISMGIAILRYRLYEIDTLINRTLVYGLLTVTLVGLYFGGVVLLQRLFVALTGEKSTLAVVASTLAIAALFNPP